MNFKKLILSLISIVTFALIIFMQSVTYATTATGAEVKYLGITEKRQTGNPQMGYAIKDPNDNTSSNNSGTKLWNIVKYSSLTSSDPTDGNIYCLKAEHGVSFRQNKRATYNVFFDMKIEKSQISQLNTTLKALTEGTVEGVDKYNAILALGDLLYIKKYDDMVVDSASTAEERTALLEAADIYDDMLTDEDIIAVQQAAIWYFTNYGEDNNKYNLFDQIWLKYTTDGKTYTSLGDYQLGTGEGRRREENAYLLYEYLIDTAKANASKYANTSNVGAPVEVDTTTLAYTESGSNCIVGPIHITKNNDMPYTIDFVAKNGNNTVDYKLLNENKNEVQTGTTVKDLVGKNFYISVPKSAISGLSVNINVNYSNTKMTLWASGSADEQPVFIPVKEKKSVPVTLNVPNEKIFDLALRKYITKVNDVELTGTSSRVPNIDKSTLTSGKTATYKHKKDPVVISTGDKVTYKLTIYNEGEKPGYATKIVDQLPTGLKFSKVVSGNFELDSYSETNNTLNLKRKSGNTTSLPAYTNGNLSSETIEIECEVTATPDTKDSKILTNVAWISEEVNSEDNITITNQKGNDRDSEPATKPDVNKDNMENYTGNNNKSDLTDSNYYYKGEQDDDDFEKLVLLPESFDLKLIKRITEVNGQKVPERIEKVDVSKLNTIDENGNMITTGDYKLNKEPVGVKKGDIVTYTFRIYNEGTIDGYASEITEDIPEGLQFLWSEKEGEELKADTTLTEEEKAAIEFNQDRFWTYADKTLKTVKTDYLSRDNETIPGDGSNLIKAFGKNDGTKTEKDIDYKEISIMLEVISENTTGTIIKNEACISEDTDKNGKEVDDRDSDTEKWVKYEDDEDFDKIVLQSFDLALRKFIIAVSDDEKIEDKEYLKNQDGSYKRAPVVDTSKLNTVDENGNMITTAIYNHTKEPVLVQKNNIVVYMLRVYNEGDMDGYAGEIKDHLPSYLEFVDSEFNKQYGWESSEDGRTVTTKYLDNSLIKAAEELSHNEEAEDTSNSQKYKLSYKEVPIMCKVKDSAKTNENITNIADITKYLDENKNSVTDRDSQENNVKLPDDKDLPGYKDDENGSYVPGQQDDDDFEKVIVKEFDLALRKWVTQAIVIENGNQTVTDTGHDAWDDPEQVVKVELHRKKLNQVTVKFRYSIRVINQGDIAGYAKEVTDYIPEGLKFVAEDNPGWTDEGNNVISTRLLENTLLQPGEYADVEVLLTWINNENNMGVMNNTAEISEDYNEYGVPDKDSTPDNKKPGEDDIDDAPVMLSVSTGQIRIYFTLGLIVLITVAGGVVLIKKYVL